MFPFEYLLALALLTAPAGGPQPEINPDLCPGLRLALQQCAAPSAGAEAAARDARAGGVLRRPPAAAHARVAVPVH
jgi:hypothetical protein